MKTLLTSAAAVLFTLSATAQNKQVQSETKTTVTTVKDSEGEKQYVKEQKVQQTQDIQFQPDNNSLNKRTKETPVEVTSTTQITNPDGTTRTVDVDRSSTYTYNGQEYKVALDASGYTVSSPTFKTPARMRKTSINTYIYRGKDRTSIGYFDTDGNLILETYDDKSDQVTVEKYVRK